MIIFARAPGTAGWVEIKPEEELSHRGQFWEIRKFAVESDDALPLARRLDRAEQALRMAGFKYHGPTEKWLAPARVAGGTAQTEALAALLHLVDEFGIKSGVCCCGDDMARHSNPMDCGHSPVDSGEYYSAQTIEVARAALGVVPEAPGGAA